MPLIKCPECECLVSNKAVTCPQCGFPISKTEKRNIAKFVFSVIKRYILNFFVKLSILLKKMFHSKWSLIAFIMPIVICGIFALCMFGMWIFEQLMEFNSVIGLISLLIAANIGGYFFLYRDSRIWIKIFLWFFLIFEIIGVIYIFNLFNN